MHDTGSLLDPCKPSQSDFGAAPPSGLLILAATVLCAMAEMWKHLCGCTNILQILSGMWLTGIFACNVAHTLHGLPRALLVEHVVGSVLMFVVFVMENVTIPSLSD